MLTKINGDIHNVPFLKRLNLQIILYKIKEQQNFMMDHFIRLLKIYQGEYINENFNG